MSEKSVMIVLGLLLPLALAGQTAPAKPKATKNSVQTAIEKLIDEYAAAARRGDAAFFEKNLARDYIGIEADGHASTKPEVLDLLRSGTIKFQTVDIKNRNVRVYGNAAVVIGEVNLKGSTATTVVNGTYISTRVLERGKDGQWQMVISQLTKVR